MDITVAICTRNRASSLARTLQSFTEIELPSASWELLVIDNGSSDDTAQMVASFADRLPIRIQFEAKAGLSHARNHAIAAARGKYIAWTDDDVLVDRHWLAAYAAAFTRWPDASLFGGRILPVLEEPSVPWFRDNLAMISGLVAARDLGDDPILLSVTGDRVPFGANFAMRMHEQRQFPYDPELGVAPGRRRLGEETTVCKAMLQAGHCGRWVPESLVHHLISRSRQTIQYVRAFYMALGESETHVEGRRNVPTVQGMPRWLIRRMLSRYFSYRIARATAKPEVWLAKLIELAYDQGALAYWRQSSQQTHLG